MGLVNNETHELLKNCKFRYQTALRSKNFWSVDPVFASALLHGCWEADVEDVFTLSDKFSA